MVLLKPIFSAPANQTIDVVQRVFVAIVVELGVKIVIEQNMIHTFPSPVNFAPPGKPVPWAES